MARKPSRLELAWTAGRIASRRVLGRKDGAKDLELGTLLSGQLDEVKGLAMKLGQIVSYMDVPLPESVQQQLTRLQHGVHGLTEDQTRAALAEALGADWATRVPDLQIEPIAAASIGQVHRARLDGQAIALKLQYPGVAATFRKDLGGLDKIASLASIATAVDGRSIVGELSARLAEECDYRREAAYQRAFATAFADDPDIHIPAVVASLSTATTLATTWADGDRFDDACRAPQTQRNRYAEGLVYFCYRSMLVLATVQADPHPGNYLFGPGDRVTFLDFGCVRAFDSDFVARLRAMIQALDHGDRAAFRQVVLDLKMAPKPKRFDFEHHYAAMEHLHRPLLQSHFTFTPTYVREGLAYNGPTSPNARQMSLPPAYIWVARLQWGLWSVLTRLGADVALREILDAALAAPVTPLKVQDQASAADDESSRVVVRS